MRLSFVCHEFPPTGGGAATALDALSAALAERGHTVQVITIGLGKDTKCETDTVGREIVRLGARRQSVLAPSAKELLRSYVALRYAAAPVLRAFHPEVLVAYFGFPAGRACLPARRELGVPLVVSLRGSDVPGFSKKRWGGWGALQGALIKPAWRGCDLLLANGRQLCELAEAYLPGCGVINMPNGVDIRRYHPPSRRAGGPAVRLLFVGQLIERKRCLELLDALTWFGQRGGHAELTMVGDGPQRSALEQKSRTLPASVHVTIAGAQGREALPEIYRGHDGLVHLSRAEGISNVLLEALASGLAIVATRTAAGEVVTEAEAVLVDEVTPTTVGEALARVAGDAGELRRLQEAARARAESMSWEVAAGRFEDELSRLVP